MRLFLALVFTLSLLAPAQAASGGYDLFLLACDGVSDCQRVATLNLGADGQKSDYPTPGLNVRIDPVSALPEGAVIKLAMTLNPPQLFNTAVRGSGGPVSIQVDSAVLRHAYYSPLVVFTLSSKVYQLWGRQVTSAAAAAKSLALR